MTEISHMWDRLAGALIIYVENYLLSKQSYSELTIKPSYDVDYEIEDSILEYLEKSYSSENINDIWQHKIAGCKNINELPFELKQLVNQFLPRFFLQYPQYRCEESLKILS